MRKLFKNLQMLFVTYFYSGLKNEAWAFKKQTGGSIF